ncbi:MAG: sulfate adenylyltransferase [Deltaproteobacteria bacterium]|nr:sulfate adenylyltransferase [Deltaproteobacteria bacterium]
MAFSHQEGELLRFSTAGSVDDGKSTLIGRLLYDTKSALDDQLDHIEVVSRRRGDERVNLALLTDGLRAEREQGITIDVAYHYFATERRKFIIADTPGHVQYTPNMVTGASTAALAVVLVDARCGIVEQTRRHVYLASLLRIPHLILAVNKMDLIDWDEQWFRRIDLEFREFSARLGLMDVTIIPVSALTGENVVARTKEMPWYGGPTLLHHLETIHIATDRTSFAARFPVQYVIRPQSPNHPDYRGYAGQIASGVLTTGDEIVVLPSGIRTRITSIEQGGRPLDQALAAMSVTIHVADDCDIGRGDVLCHPTNEPCIGQELDAMVCWMAEHPLKTRDRYLIKQTTRTTRAFVTEIVYRLDVNTNHRETDWELGMNALGRIRLRTTTPIIYDAYSQNRAMGSFILIDEHTNQTVAAGMLHVDDK